MVDSVLCRHSVTAPVFVFHFAICLQTNKQRNLKFRGVRRSQKNRLTVASRTHEMKRFTVGGLQPLRKLFLLPKITPHFQL